MSTSSFVFVGAMPVGIGWRKLMAIEAVSFSSINTRSRFTSQKIFSQSYHLKMFWIHTFTISTKMVDLHTRCYRTLKSFVSKSMGVSLSPIVSDDTIIGTLPPCLASSPYPTFSSLPDFSQESIHIRDARILGSKFSSVSFASFSMTDLTDTLSWLFKSLTIFRRKFVSVFAMGLISIVDSHIEVVTTQSFGGKAFV